MKKEKDYTIVAMLLVFTLAILGSMVGYGQCSTRNFAVSPAIGFSKSGPSIYAEVGSHSSVPMTFSYFAGIEVGSNANHDKEDKEDDNALPLKYEPFYLDAYGRVALKIAGQEESILYHFITASASVRGNLTASYRLSRSFADVLIGIEPNYSTRNSAGINIVLTGRL
jgi:hypothetical protein